MPGDLWLIGAQGPSAEVRWDAGMSKLVCDEPAVGPLPSRIVATVFRTVRRISGHQGTVTNGDG
jgi:hypothetical protein